MCLNPKWIYNKGHYKESNYRGKKGEFYEIGTFAKCGICEVCRNQRSNEWVQRNYYEAKHWNGNACFITLTYEKPPIFLVRKDLTDFIKRFRYEINKEYYKKLKNVSKALQGEQLELWKKDHEDEFTKTRFYTAGEYGDKHGRAHFHLIIYGWRDREPKYLGIAKKSKSILYQSKIIQKTWGKGRTSYQNFTENKEAVYISLYQTPGEEFKRAYKLNLEKVKQIRAYVESKKRTKQYKNLLIELAEYEKELKKSKEQWIAIKEFNGWSIALGWEEFEKQYKESKIYTFTEYIEDKEFPTCTSWLKKLANGGDERAAQELFRREEEYKKPDYKNIELQTLEAEELARNQKLKAERKKRELEEWQTNRKNEEIEVI